MNIIFFYVVLVSHDFHLNRIHGRREHKKIQNRCWSFFIGFSFSWALGAVQCSLSSSGLFMRCNKRIVATKQFSQLISIFHCAPFMIAKYRISNVAVCKANPIKLGYEVDAVFVGIFLLLIQRENCLKNSKSLLVIFH